MQQDKHILILSQETDKSTDDVIHFLLYFKQNVIRINETDIINSLNIVIDSESEKLALSANTLKLDLSNIKSFWYRRGKLNFEQFELNDISSKQDQIIYKAYLKYLLKETRALENYLYKRLNDLKHINSFSDNYISKINQLSIASKCGISIPKTLISDDLNIVLSKIKGKNILIKALDFHIFNIIEQDKEFKCSRDQAIIVNRKDFANRKKIFSKGKCAISLFQEYIDKKFEIRSFFLDGNFYSMAIFSQQNPKTKVDYRNYDDERPNRNVPIKLPKILENRLIKLLKRLELNSGSIDLIYTPEGEYVFLEVNPIGQFDWLSKNCNYHLDYIISKYLIDENKFNKA